MATIRELGERKIVLRSLREGIDTSNEGAVFNAEIAAAVQEKLAGSNYGTQLAERGITTVALDENGDVVEHRPDGSSVAVSSKRKARDA